MIGEDKEMEEEAFKKKRKGNELGEKAWGKRKGSQNMCLVASCLPSFDTLSPLFPALQAMKLSEMEREREYFPFVSLFFYLSKEKKTKSDRCWWWSCRKWVALPAGDHGM